MKVIALTFEVTSFALLVMFLIHGELCWRWVGRLFYLMFP